jgi:undecaprenyl-diphosphatase
VLVRLWQPLGTMNDYSISTLLGVIEGLTEFLPVSSTAHLRFVEALLHVDLADGYWKMYTIVIQLGAVLCLPFYFRRELSALVATYPRGPRGNRGLLTHPLGLVGLAFVTTAVPSLLLTKVIGHNLERLTTMGIALIGGGIVMWIVDAVSRRQQSLDGMSIGQALWIGLCQVLSAVFPGTSRSMATIASGQLAGLSRSSALEFSFLLALPTMLAATLYDLFKSLRGDQANAIGVATIDAHGWTVLAIGFGISFIVAYASVAWLMEWVRRRGFAPFAAYRVAFGALVLVVAARGY